MSFKKLGASLFLSAVVLLIPLSSAFAAAGWQYLGFDSFHKNSKGYYVSDVYTSDGGYIRICAATYKEVIYRAYEYDPDNADDYIDGVLLSNGECYDFKVEGYRDGSNNRPEIYFNVGTYSLAGGDIWD
jgi:hypothetical protein